MIILKIKSRVMLFFVFIVILIFLDYFNIFTYLKFSVDGWSIIISTIVTISISLYAINLQKQNERKRILVESCLNQELFRLFYTHKLEVYSDEFLPGDNLFICGLHSYDILILNEFMSKIKIVSNSKIISATLKNRCLSFLEDAGNHLSVSKINRVDFMYPMLTVNIYNKPLLIFSKNYHEIWAIGEKDANNAVVYFAGIRKSINEYNVRETIKKAVNFDINDSLNFFLFTDIKSNSDFNEKLNQTKIAVYNHFRNKGILGVANFEDKGFFPGNDGLAIVYTKEVKLLCEEIISELSN